MAEVRLLIPKGEHGSDRILGWGITRKDIKRAMKYSNLKVKQKGGKVLVVHGSLHVVYKKIGEDLYKICTAFHK